MPDPTPRRSLDPVPDEMRRLGHLVVERVVEHLAGLGERPVAAPGPHAELSALVDEPLPEEGHGIEDGIRFFAERVLPRLTHVDHPRFHAYVPCPSSFAGAVGGMLAAGTNPFVGSWLGGATVAALELTVLRWIAELVGYPAESPGILTSGGSTANLIGLAAARAWRGGEASEGARIYVSAEGHASMDKAAHILGFPAEAVRAVPVDERARMRADALERFLEEDRRAGHRPFFVCANAGTVNTGSVDPLEAIADLCTREALWLHVDGAYGGFAAVCERGRRALAGMERADSLTLDPHKWLYAPMGTGCALVRDAGALHAAFSARGEYLRDLPPGEVNFFDRGPELSRPARVLGAWMVVRSTGRRELARQIEQDLELARLAARLLAEEPRFEIVMPPELSVVAFRHRVREGESEDVRAARDDRLQEATLRDGTLMISTTRVGGRSLMRLVVMSHRTTEEDVRRSVAKLRELAS